MSNYVNGYYCVWLRRAAIVTRRGCQIRLDDEAEKAYCRAKMLRLPFDGIRELEDALSDAYDEIKYIEINKMARRDDRVLVRLGWLEVLPDEINELVEKRDPHTLEFFNLTELSDEELDAWDAERDLEKLPAVCDFVENFEPSSPFDERYSLKVGFIEDPEYDDLYDSEVIESLHTLLKESNGDYQVVEDYIERCGWLYCGDSSMKELAIDIAKELALTDFLEKHSDWEN